MAVAIDASGDTLIATSIDASSDYGSDFDDEVLQESFSKALSPPPDDIVLTHIEQDPVTEHAVVQLLTSSQSLQGIAATESRVRTVVASVSAKIEYSTSDEGIIAVNPNNEPKRDDSQAETAVTDESLSPLERFRTHPKKPLSVTDIVSPAWCEQQYLYSLSKHGRVRRTPAMKQGSKVHKVLEEQVHTTVRIEVKTREDKFGLKLWNVIQGLRTLRATGIAREFEVWGLLGGQVVNGIIDQITTECPDEALESRIISRSDKTQGQKKKKQETLESNQTTLSGFLTSTQSGKSLEQSESSQRLQPSRTYYLVDVKTRQSRTLPANDGRLRPTQMQLMLYHRLLSTLALDMVDKNAIFERYNLNGHMIFSDVFITEISRLDDDAYLNTAINRPEEDSLTELLAHNTLDALWLHMVAELAKTIPIGLSPVLAAEYRTSDTGSLLGKRSFEFDNARLDEYVSDELSWWKGERATKGVEIEEAFKCRICEFAEGCSWRQNKIKESVQHNRQRKASRELAANG